jgi:hypothetical protein
MVLTSIIVVVLLVPNVQALQHAYDAPCNVGDWEHRGQCCPADTNQIAHSMCYTKEEYQQRKQHTNEIVPCILANAVKRDLFGYLDCIIK